ncbi:MAG TPA: hypothetical protein DIW77_20715, partial [Chromatiaceae bacterium]|nr:hypothetical protein [Chromatiaceae bacterium]
RPLRWHHAPDRPQAGSYADRRPWLAKVRCGRGALAPLRLCGEFLHLLQAAPGLNEGNYGFREAAAGLSIKRV